MSIRLALHGPPPLTPLTMSYEAAKKRAEPYTKIVKELPEMRRDTVELVKQAAPLTIQALRIRSTSLRNERRVQ